MKKVKIILLDALFARARAGVSASHPGTIVVPFCGLCCSPGQCIVTRAVGAAAWTPLFQAVATFGPVRLPRRRCHCAASSCFCASSEANTLRGVVLCGPLPVLDSRLSSATVQVPQMPLGRFERS